MKFRQIRKILFRKKRRNNTINLDAAELSERKSESISKELWKDPDKSIFEIRDSFTMNERGIVIYGKVKRGFFKVGDTVLICNPIDTNAKLEAKIMKIMTQLLESNKINCGLESEMLIAVNGNCKETFPERQILPGDRAYKKAKSPELIKSNSGGI